MISLDTHLGSLNFSTQLEEVNNLLAKAKTDVTFWGTRVVRVDGFSSSASLEKLSYKINKISEKRSEADDLTPLERIAGLETVTKLKNFYYLTDIQIENSNFLTRLIVWIREFSFIPYTTRFYLDLAGNMFQGYSKEKFIKEFGDIRDKNGNHPAETGFISPPYRILAKPSSIRAQIVPNSPVTLSY